MTERDTERDGVASDVHVLGNLYLDLAGSMGYDGCCTMQGGRGHWALNYTSP